MSVVIFLSFKDLLLFDLKVFALFLCGSALLFNFRREEELSSFSLCLFLSSLKNSFVDFLFVFWFFLSVFCLRGCSRRVFGVAFRRANA